MRPRIVRRVLALAVIPAVLGVGATRADAAGPATLQWYTGNFVVSMSAVYVPSPPGDDDVVAHTGNPVTLRCSDSSQIGIGTVSVPRGTTRSGMTRTFHCAAGAEELWLTYTGTVTYASNSYASIVHRITVAWAPSASTLYSACAIGTAPGRLSGLFGVPASPHFASQSTTVSAANTCGAFRVSGTATFREGWAAT